MRREDFPIFDGELIYLDTAATAQKPRAVIDATQKFYTQAYGTVHRAIYDLSVHATEACGQVRHKAAGFINAPSDEEIIFTKGATEAINLVASSFGQKFVDMGDEIIITELEHHSNIVPWQLMCEQRGATLHIAPVDDSGQLLIEEFESLLSSKTRLIALPHVTNSLGTLNPIAEVVASAHALGAKVLVDGCQAVGHLPIDVQALGADFYVFSGHKIYGPTGIGVLWGRRDLLGDLPPYQGGGDMIEEVTFERTTYNVLPFRFEAGTPNIAGIIGLGAAFDYIESIGIEAIAAHEQQLVEHAITGLQSIPDLHLFAPQQPRGSILSFVVDNVHPLDIGTLLNLKGIAIRTGHLCAQPTMQRFGVSAMCRISFGVYNTISDIDTCLDALQRAIKELL